MIKIVTLNNKYDYQGDCSICSLDEMIIDLGGCKSLCFYVQVSDINPRHGRIETMFLWNTKKRLYYVIDALTISVSKCKDPIEDTMLIGNDFCVDIEFLFNHGIAPKKVYDISIGSKIVSAKTFFPDTINTTEHLKINKEDFYFYDYESVMWDSFNAAKSIGLSDEVQKSCEFLVPTAWAKWSSGNQEDDVFSEDQFSDNIEEFQEKREILTKFINELCIPRK